MYYCSTMDARNAVLMSYANGVLLNGDYEKEATGLAAYLLEMNEGRDLGVPDKVIGVALMVIDEGIKLDQAPYTKRIVFGGVWSNPFRCAQVSLRENFGKNLCSLRE